jgi:hypothetical protein
MKGRVEYCLNKLFKCYSVNFYICGSPSSIDHFSIRWIGLGGPTVCALALAKRVPCHNSQ